MLTTTALLLPSVPTMLIDEQRGDFTEMIEAVTAAGEPHSAESPDVVVDVSSRWMSAGAFHTDDAREHKSVIDLPGFGVEPRYHCTGHPAVARAIVKGAARAGLRATCSRRGTDTGISIPLHFLLRDHRIPVVPVSVGDGPRDEQRQWGETMRHVLHAREERIAFLVGGALSFNLHAFNLKRDVAEAHELDERVLSAIKQGRWGALAEFGDALLEKAHPDAGLRHLEVMRGFLLGDRPGRVVEHESSPGLGTALAEFVLDAYPEPVTDD